MTIPSYQQAMLPVLRALTIQGAKHRRELSSLVADHFALGETERAALLPSGKMTVIMSRVGWALAYLKQSRLIDSPRRGIYQITDRGREAIAKSPENIDTNFLLQFAEFREFRERSRVVANEDEREDKEAPEPARTTSDDLAPDEALETAYARLRASLEAELLDAVKQATPSFFEQLVIDLLVRMGYGGSRPEAARAVGRSGDGGIDGVIDEDRLGLDAIYVQAKRWDAAVGRPEIQKFAGALQGQRAKKGLFITTSNFTREAEEFAQRIDTRLVLIDGRRLASLMFEFDVGVNPRTSYTVKQLDSDYFEDT
ncbi:MAG: restriction endonuclease [Betaproteobacteria bacterium]|nr:restriction endonuclease [Betaproteobacteria bacterium]